MPVPGRPRRGKVRSRQQGHGSEVPRASRRAWLPRGGDAERVQPQGPHRDRVASDRLQVRQNRRAAVASLPGLASRSANNSPKSGHHGPLISDCEHPKRLSRSPRFGPSGCFRPMNGPLVSDTSTIYQPGVCAAGPPRAARHHTKAASATCQSATRDRSRASGLGCSRAPPVKAGIARTGFRHRHPVARRTRNAANRNLGFSIAIRGLRLWPRSAYHPRGYGVKAPAAFDPVHPVDRHPEIFLWPYDFRWKPRKRQRKGAQSLEIHGFHRPSGAALV